MNFIPLELVSCIVRAVRRDVAIVFVVVNGLYLNTDVRCCVKNVDICLLLKMCSFAYTLYGVFYKCRFNFEAILVTAGRQPIRKILTVAIKCKDIS